MTKRANIIITKPKDLELTISVVNENLNLKGKFFTAKIRDTFVKGKIQVEDNKIFLCQNKFNGKNCSDSLGFKYSWTILEGLENDLNKSDVTEFKIYDYLPMDGELFYVSMSNDYSCIGLATEGKHITSSSLHFILNSTRICYQPGSVCYNEEICILRPINVDEKNIFYKQLALDNMMYNEEKKVIEPIPNFYIDDLYIFWQNDKKHASIAKLKEVYKFETGIRTYKDNRNIFWKNCLYFESKKQFNEIIR